MGMKPDVFWNALEVVENRINLWILKRITLIVKFF